MAARVIKLLINYVKDIGFYKLQLWIELLDRTVVRLFFYFRSLIYDKLYCSDQKINKRISVLNNVKNSACFCFSTQKN